MASKSENVTPAKDAPAPEDKPSTGGDVVKLKRRINLFNGVTILVGTIIGSGIFVSPKGVLLNSGGSVGVAMIVWTACGILSAFGALSFVELGTSITKSGGDYAYLYEAFGPIPAFLRLWTQFVLIRPAVMAVLSLTAGRYILQPFFLDCDTPEPAIKLLAASAILVLTFMNCYSVKLSTWIQDVFAVGKVLGLGVIIVAGIVQLANGATENFQNTFEGNTISPEGIPLAIYSGLFAFSGWFYLNTLTEEVQNPKRNLPLAILIGVAVVMVIYLLTNIAYFTTLTPQEVLTSDAVAVTFAQRVLGVMAWVVPVAVAVSCFGSTNGLLLSASRVTFVGARDGYLPDLLAMIHVNMLTPLPAVALLCPIALLMLTTNDVYRLINFLSAVRWLFIGLATATVPYLRWRRPDMHRPWKVPLVLPIIFSLVCVVVVAMSLYSAPVDVGIGLALTLTGVPVYLLAVWRNKPGWLIKFTASATRALQSILLVVPQEAPSSTSENPQETASQSSPTSKTEKKDASSVSTYL
ncbi:cystine/glutamate transporter-like [Branchiostoma floridae]|uniref:Cystine/glutamate transporter-like n=1 Tax=Branchiostoma floridae TaxID=7739 RepID=A0A9J7KUZ7_BRAFL|nr:cystine/glutamate transporter-like [Branchiostoma floridae]